MTLYVYNQNLNLVFPDRYLQKKVKYYIELSMKCNLIVCRTIYNTISLQG